MKTPADIVKRYGRQEGLRYHAYLAAQMGSEDLPIYIMTFRQLGADRLADKYEEQWIKGKIAYAEKYQGCV